MKAYGTELSRWKIEKALAYMPPLSHWPLRPAPFRDEASLVLAYIMGATRCSLEIARRVFEAMSRPTAKRGRVLVFNPASRLWAGRKHGAKERQLAKRSPSASNP